MAARPDVERLRADALRFEGDFPAAAKALLFVEDRGKEGAYVPLALNDAQKKLFEVIQRIQRLSRWMNETIGEDLPVRLLIGKCRQSGFSTLVEALFFWEAVFRPMRVSVVAHTQKAAANVFAMAKRFVDLWPIELLGLLPQNESEARDRMEFDNGSRYEVTTAAGADPRSFRFDRIHLSEYAHYGDYGAVSAGVIANPRAWIIKESTANGMGGPFYEEWKRALSITELEAAYKSQDAERLAGWNRYVKFFYSWLEDPGYKMRVFDWERRHIEGSLDQAERELVARHHASLEQIKWRRAQLEEIRDRKTDELRGLLPEQFFKQEFPADERELFQASGTRFFDPVALERMTTITKGRIAHHVRYDGSADPVEVLPSMANLTVWEPPERGRSYALGADTSYGLEKGDFSAAVVLDRGDGTIAREVALWRGRIEAETFGDVLTFLAEWYGMGFLVPEVNGPGLATCRRILSNRYPFLYHRKAEDAVTEHESEERSFRFGFYTTNMLKDYVCSSLQTAIKTHTVHVRSPVLIDELHAFEVKQKKGGGIRLGAAAGAHDDCVIALALAYFGHSSGVAPPVEPPQAKMRRETAKNPERSDQDRIWEVIRRKQVLIEKRNRKILGRDWRPA